MNTYKIGQEGIDKKLIELGDKIELTSQTQEVVECIKSGVKMLNIDADELKPGDLSFIKKLGLTISNPETTEAIALGVEHKTFGRKLADWFERESDEEDNDDDTDFFSPTPSSGGSFFGGSSGFGGFGGFGGGSFSGGGMNRGF